MSGRFAYSASAARCIVALLASAGIQGCAATLYDWGRYENGLSAHYIGSDDGETRTELERTVTQLQQGDPRRIPPGVLADYGFVLYQRGEYERAIEYFQREAKLFPESAALMNKLIARVRERQGGSDSPRRSGAAAILPPKGGGMGQPP